MSLATRIGLCPFCRKLGAPNDFDGMSNMGHDECHERLQQIPSARAFLMLGEWRIASELKRGALVERLVETEGFKALTRRMRRPYRPVFGRTI